MLEKKDLYLSDEQISSAYSGALAIDIPPKLISLYYYHRDGGKAIAKASADYAVKQVVEWLKQNTIISGFPYGGRYLSPEDWQALKELAKGTSK